MGEGQPAANQSPTGPQPDARGEARVTVREAARLLGLTVEAVRGRIKRGTLEVERTDEGVFVWLDRENSGEDANQPPTGPQPDDRAELVESLLDQVAYMRRQLAEEREANRENRRLLAAALERIPAIEAPETRGVHEPGTKTPDEDTDEPRASRRAEREAASEPREWPASTESAHYGTSPQEAQESLQRRSWWRRWFGLE